MVGIFDFEERWIEAGPRALLARCIHHNPACQRERRQHAQALRLKRDEPADVMARRSAPRPFSWITTPGGARLVMTTCSLAAGGTTAWRSSEMDCFVAALLAMADKVQSLTGSQPKRDRCRLAARLREWRIVHSLTLAATFENQRRHSTACDLAAALSR